MKRAEIIASLLEQARDKDTLVNGDPNSIFASDEQMLREAQVLWGAAMMLFAVNDWVPVKNALPPKGHGRSCVAGYAESHHHSAV